MNVGKTSPLTIAHFDEFFRLLPDRAESEKSWTVSRAQIEARGFDLKMVNPNRKVEVDERTPEQIIDIIKAKAYEVAAALSELRGNGRDRGGEE